MKALKYISYCLLTVVMLAGCSSSQRPSARNFATQYQEQNISLRPLLRLFHADANRLEAHIQLNTEDLLYMRTPNGSIFQSQVKFTYILYSDDEFQVVADSGLVVMVDSQAVQPSGFIHQKIDIQIPIANPKDVYYLHINILDANRKYETDLFEEVYPTDSKGRQNYLPVDLKGRVIQEDYLKTTDVFKVLNNSNASKYYIKYYSRDFPVAALPYSSNKETTFNFKPDSMYAVSANAEFRLASPGIYLITIDSTSKNGLALYHYSDHFPMIEKKTDLGPPLRYLTSNAEYASIMSGNPDSMKLAVDQFWLRNAGSVERGKVVVESYYSRVANANLLFTSYLEGWKTDRGIIYIIYGPPSFVYRGAYEERWVYGDENSSLRYVFSFQKMINPLSKNDYTMVRLSTYSYGWKIAIDAWRHGQIYDVKDIQKEQNARDAQLRRTAPPYIWN